MFIAGSCASSLDDDEACGSIVALELRLEDVSFSLPTDGDFSLEV